jgi:cold shock CspA family protein
MERIRGKDESMNETNTDNRMTGTVTKVLLNKGFAFVRGEQDGISRFAHAHDFEPAIAFDTLREGKGVTFEPSRGPETSGNGLRAIKIRVV